MNDNTSGYIFTAYSIFTLPKHMYSILVANVYVYSLVLRALLLPCHKKLKNSKFSKRLEAAKKATYGTYTKVWIIQGIMGLGMELLMNAYSDQGSWTITCET